jgi:adenylate cyclase
MNYTVMGDPVNVAARLESLNKAYGTTILLAQSTARLAGPDVLLREIDRATLAGRDEPVAIFELLGRTGSVDETAVRLSATYAEGLAAYRRRDWVSAATEFRNCLELRSQDGPAQVLLARTDRFRLEAPPDDWDGTWPAGGK